MIQISLLEALSFLGRLYIIGTLALVVASAVYIKLNRMQSVYQKSLVKHVKNIKKRKQEFESELNSDKLEKREKKYHKAVKKLEKRIKRIMFFNRNIIISNSLLLSNENLALKNEPEFTFNSKLDELINEFNKKHKRHKTINSVKNKKVATVTPRELNEEEKKSLTETETNTQTKPLEEVSLNIDENLEKNIYQEENLFSH